MVTSIKEEQVKAIGLLPLLLLVLLGAIAVPLPIVISLTWLVVISLTIYAYFTDKMEWVWYGIAASPALETWARMSKAPMVPYEIGKYYLILTVITLLFYHVKYKSYKPVFYVGVIFIALLLPSLVVALADFDREQWVFNILGLVELGVLLFFASRERWDINRFCKTIRVALLPIISILIFLTLRSPGFSEMSFMLGANVEAAGGFGTNQVSTILGNGILLTALLLMLNYPLFSYKWMSVVLIGYLSVRGLLTFSRGGMLGAFMSIVVALLPIMFSSFRTFTRYFLLIGSLIFLGWGMFSIINNATDNKLMQRYKGETEGTLSGNRKKTLNVATSGRADLIMADINIFQNSPFFGVGPGGAKDLRTRFGAVENSAAHTEVTRLMSEHGVGGLLAALLFMLFPLFWIWKQKLNIWQGITSGLFMIAIFTSMHSAMRTNTTVVFYTLAAIPVIMNDYWLMRLRRL